MKIKTILNFFTFVLIFCIISFSSFALYLNYKMSQGPIPLNFITEKFETYLSEISPDYNFKLDKLLLKKGEGFLPLEFLIEGLNLTDIKGNEITSINRLGIEFSIRDLLRARLIPRRIHLYQGHLLIEKSKDKGLSVGFSNFQKNEDEDEKELLDSNTQEALIITPEYVMNDLEALLNKYAYMSKIHFEDSSISYIDRVNEIYFELPKINGRIENQREHVYGSYEISLQHAQKQIQFEGQFDYNKTHDYLLMDNHFNDISLKAFPWITNYIDNNTTIENLDLNADMHFSFHYDLIKKSLISILEVSQGNGQISWPAYLDKPLDLTDMSLSLTYYGLDEKLILKSMELKADQVPLSASFEGKIHENTLTEITLDASTTNLAFLELHKYWPKQIANSARDWVLSHIQKGLAEKATIHVQLETENDALTPKKIEGQIDYNHLEVDYFNPMPLATNLSGTINFDRDNFNINIKEGSSNSLELTRGVIVISDMSAPLQHIDIDLDLKGKAHKVFEFVEGNPLNLLEKYDIHSSHISGDSLTNLKLKFPLIGTLQTKDIQVTLKSDVQKANLTLEKQGISLTNNDLKIYVNNDQMKVDGKGYINKSPAQFLWTEYFKPQNDIFRNLNVKGEFTAESLDPFIPEIDEIFSGPMALSLQMTENTKGIKNIEVDFDLTKARVDLLDFNYQNPVGKNSKGSLKIAYEPNLIRHADFMIEADDLDIQGRMMMNPVTKELDFLELSNFQIGDSNLTISIQKDTGNIYQVNVSGELLDFDALWKRREKLFKDKGKKAAYDVHLDLDQLRFPTRRSLNDLRIEAKYRDGYLDFLDLSAKGKHGAFVKAKLQEDRNNYYFHSEINNFGYILQMGNIYESMRDGDLIIKSKAAKHNRQYKGNFSLTDYNLKGNLPLLAKVANILSIQGLGETLSNKGIVFKRSEGDFEYKDKIFGLKNMTTTGSSLGLTAKGIVNLNKDHIDIEGSVVPMHGINSFLGNIPLIGELLIGKKGEGMFAANYRLKGNIQQAKSKVNPVSVITPGILRRIFFQNKSESFEKHLRSHEAEKRQEIEQEHEKDKERDE